MARSQNTSKTTCPVCKKIQEDCAKAEQCQKWKTSYRVCMAFGTVKYRADLDLDAPKIPNPR